MARPTLLTEDIVAQAREYIDNFEEYEHAIPSVVGLCKVIKIGKSTVYDWAAVEGSEFSDILAEINETQELVTFNKALKGDYNASIAKLLLGKHGYHDKQDQTLSAPGGGPVQTSTNIVFTPVGNESD